MKTLLFFFVLLLISISAKAATYNFYFNNTEQGKNSTANPSLTVQDGKQVPAGTPDEKEAGSAEAADAVPAPVSPTENEGGTTVAAIPPMESTFPDAKWKFSLGSMQTRYNLKDQSTNYDYRENPRLNGSLTYYPTREAGFTFHVGRLLGPELEINPFGVRTGWGKMQFGLLLAVLKDTIGYEVEDDGFWSSPFTTSAGSISRSGTGSSIYYEPTEMVRKPIVRTKPINFYTGAQLGLNVVRDLSLNLAYRIAPFEQNERITSAIHWSLNYLF